MKNLSETNYFIIFLILLFIHPLVASYHSKLYNETEPFIIDQVFTFDDGTFIMNLLHPINETCVKPQFNFRTLHPNGTFSAFEVYLPIPEFNFCSGPPNGKYLFFIRRFSSFLSVLYVNSTNILSSSYYTLFITQTGDVISNMYITSATMINKDIYRSGRLQPYVDNESFLFTKHHEIKPIILWSYFNRSDDNGTFNLSNSGEFHLTNPLDPYLAFSGIDGNFGFLTFLSSNSIRMTPGPAFQVFFTFINPITNKQGATSILYSSSLPNLVNKYDIEVDCNPNRYTKIINNCIFKFINLSNKKIVNLMEILFKDSGAIMGSKTLKIRLNIGEIYKSTNLIDLYNGGYIFYSYITKNNRQIFNGSILNDNKNYLGVLDFPSYIKASKFFQLSTSNSGVAFLITQNDEKSWEIFSTTLPKFLIDVGYGNPYVNSTYPAINSSIPLSITYINITYNFPISTSNNNILIYQYYNGTPLIRQSISGKSPSFSSNSDNKTISIKVLNCTFNQPNSKYIVVVEDDTFVELSSNQPLLGISNNHWNFSTTGRIYKFAGPVTGIFRLTVDGTKYFINLSPVEQREFLLLLKFQLSYAIPADFRRYENAKNVQSIIEDLDLLIRQKAITSILHYNTTKFLDEEYGFQIDDSFFGKYKFHIIAGSIGLTGLVSGYFYAKKRYPAGENVAIFLFASIILDVVFDFLFIVNHGKDRPELFIPSVIFFIFPMLVNLALCMILVVFEILEDQVFYKWFKDNANIGILFIILASIDLKVLTILSSQVAGLMIFNVDLSERAQSIIFWGNFAGLFIEDIPQFIIQRKHKHDTILYDPIPLVALTLKRL